VKWDLQFSAGILRSFLVPFIKGGTDEEIPSKQLGMEVDLDPIDLELTAFESQKFQGPVIAVLGYYQEDVVTMRSKYRYILVGQRNAVGAMIHI
jgi:hypothetical protein